MRTRNLLPCAMFLCMSSVSVFARADNEDKIMVHLGNGGDVQEVALSEVSKMTFGESDFSFVKTGGTAAYSYEDVYKMTFSLAGIGVTDAGVPSSELVLYPNPASDFVSVRGWEAEESAVLSVYSLSGQCCLKIVSWHGEPVSVAGLGRGMYILKINDKTFKFRKS